MPVADNSMRQTTVVLKNMVQGDSVLLSDCGSPGEGPGYSLDPLHSLQMFSTVVGSSYGSTAVKADRDTTPLDPDLHLMTTSSREFQSPD